VGSSVAEERVVHKMLIIK